jgi:hypothetical protein
MVKLHVSCLHASGCSLERCDPLASMRRRPEWVEESHWSFGCSECGWRFKRSEELTGVSLNAMMENFALQRDKEFTSYCCEH